MKALVTGGSGFIGRALCAELLRRGFAVDCLTRGKNRYFPGGVNVLRGDVCGRESLAALRGGYDAVFHLAGLITFDRARLPELLRVNTEGTANLLEAARNWGKPRCIFVSSAITMGVSDNPALPRDEDSLPDKVSLDTNPYLLSKLKAEEYAVAAAEAGQDVVIANPTTVYGSGDYTLNSGTLVKTLLRLPVAPCGSGGCNVVDVEDVVSGILAAYEKGKPGKRYILGGCNLPYRALYRAVIKAAGARAVVLTLPRFFKTPAALAAAVLGKVGGGRFLTAQIVNDLFMYKYYSGALAERELGWKAVTPFEETLARALAFYRAEGLL